MNSSVEELLCLLNLARIEGDHLFRIQELISHSPNWDLLLELAEFNAVLVLTVRNLERFVPDLFEHHAGWKVARSKAQKIRDASTLRMQWLEKALAAMNSAGVDVILLKGALLGNTIYQDPNYKRMNDVDVLVKWEQAERAVQLLKEIGFTSVGELLGKREISSKTHHAPPFLSSDYHCVLGLHWGLQASQFSNLKMRNAVLGPIWQDKIRLAEVPAFQMSCEDNLAHLCLHLPFYKIGLRELADVYNLVLFARPQLRWSIFAQRIKTWEAQESAYRVLSLARSLVGFDIPPGLLEGWKSNASKSCIQDTEARLRSSAILLRSRSTYLAKVEKAFSLFRLSKNYPERVKAWAATWKLTFWPKESELFALFGFTQRVSFWGYGMARIQFPIKILSALARDHGALNVLLITLMNIVMVVKETITLGFMRNGKSLAEHPARKVFEALE